MGQDFLVINWDVMIMLWFGEGCSSMSMKRIFVFDVLMSEKVMVLLDCVNLVIKLFDYILDVMNCSYMHWSPCLD